MTLDKYLLKFPGQTRRETFSTLNGKRLIDDAETPDTAKRQRNTQNDPLMANNFFSPLNDNDNGDKTAPAFKTTRSRKPPIPLITLHQQLNNPKDTYEKIQSWASKPVYFKQSGDVRYIYATDKDVFIKIKQQLNLIKFHWTSHKAEDDLYKKLVLKGVDKSYTETEVYDDCKKQFNAVVKVKQLSKQGDDGHHIQMGGYVVYLEWNTILSVPKKIIKYCCHHKISWSTCIRIESTSLSNATIVRDLDITAPSVVYLIVVSNVLSIIIVLNVRRLRVLMTPFVAIVEKIIQLVTEDV